MNNHPAAFGAAAALGAPAAPVTGRDLAQIVRRRARIALFTFVAVVGATAALTARMKPVYEAQARVIVETPAQSAGALPAGLAGLIGAARSDNALETQMEVIRSRAFLFEVIKKAKLATTPEELVGRIKLTAGGAGDVLNIGVQASDGFEAKTTADVIARVFRENVRQRIGEKSEASLFQLKKALNVAERNKNKAEDDLKAFSKQMGTSDPASLFGSRAARIEQTRNTLENLRRDIKVQQKTLIEQEKLRNTLAPTIITGTSQNKNPAIDQFQNELYRLEVDLKTRLLDFQPDHPEVRDVEAAIRFKLEGLARALKNPYSVGSQGVGRSPDYAAAVSATIAARAGIDVARTNIQENEKLLGVQQAEQRRLTEQRSLFEDKRRTRDSAVALLEQLRKGEADAQIAQTTSTPNVSTLDWATLPPGPISPKPLLNTALALAAGAILAFFMALLAEYLAQTRHDDPRLAGLPSVAGVPLLGVVPVALPAPAGAGLPVPVASAGASGEDALREIGYTLVHRHHAGQMPPTVLLVGTRSDDTTAALASQLAATLIRDGLRVTLVDADRAHPRLNAVFGKPDAPGVADVLAGRAIARDILHIGADGALRFLASGAPGDTTAFTETGLRRLFKELAGDENTDLVIVSGPSVWSVPQIAPLERATDGMVLVTPPGVPAAETVARARRLLSNGYQPHILGVVIGEESGPRSVATAAAVTPEETT